MPLLRPSELARVWRLHPKTVYGWIRERKLPAVRTPGSQYRIKSDIARAFATEHELPDLPKNLMTPGGTIGVIGKPGATVRALSRTCSERRTALTTWTTLLDGLLGVAVEPPDVLAIDARIDDVELARAIRALRKTKPTNRLAVVIYEADARQRRAVATLGIAGVCAKGDVDGLVDVVTELLDTPQA